MPQILRSTNEPEDLIKRQGRWRSSAYQAYVSDQRTAAYNMKSQSKANLLVSRALSAPDLTSF